MKNRIILLTLLILSFINHSFSQEDDLRSDGFYYLESINTSYKQISLFHFTEDHELIHFNFLLTDTFSIDKIDPYINRNNSRNYELVKNDNKYQYTSTNKDRSHPRKWLIEFVTNDNIKIRDITIDKYAKDEILKFKESKLIDSNNGLILENNMIYRVVSDMPYIKGCDSIENLNVRKLCRNIRFTHLVYGKLEHSNFNFEDETYVIRFVVEKDESLTNFKIVRPEETNPNIEKIVSDLIAELEKTKPFKAGLHEGNFVRVQMIIPLVIRNTSVYIMDEVIEDYGQNGELFEKNFDGKIYIDDKKRKLKHVKELTWPFPISSNLVNWIYFDDQIEFDLKSSY